MLFLIFWGTIGILYNTNNTELKALLESFSFPLFFQHLAQRLSFSFTNRYGKIREYLETGERNYDKK